MSYITTCNPVDLQEKERPITRMSLKENLNNSLESIDAVEAKIDFIKANLMGVEELQPKGEAGPSSFPSVCDKARTINEQLGHIYRQLDIIADCIADQSTEAHNSR